MCPCEEEQTRCPENVMYMAPESLFQLQFKDTRRCGVDLDVLSSRNKLQVSFKFAIYLFQDISVCYSVLFFH